MIEKESIFDANYQKLKPVNITLQEASKIPVLVKEMYKQLNDPLARQFAITLSNPYLYYVVSLNAK